MHDYVGNKQRKPEKEHASSKTNVTKPNKPLPAGVSLLWLRLGLQDMYDSHFFTVVYGLCFVLMGQAINRAHQAEPSIAIGLSASFLFAGPFLAIGVYEISRQRLAGEALDPLLSLFSWGRNVVAIGRYALILSAVMVLWLWMSVKLPASLSHGVSFSHFLLLALWLALALLVFAFSAVSIPMMLDQACTAQQAIKHSLQFCINNIAAMFVWGAIVFVMIGASILLQYWPLLLTGPWLGHATWHAYRSSRM